MEQVQADLPYKAFPTSAVAVERRYCTQSGLLAGGSCPSTAVGYYRADDLPAACNYSHAAAPLRLQQMRQMRHRSRLSSLRIQVIRIQTDLYWRNMKDKRRTIGTGAG